jgi:UDP-N-acetylglucosamine 1-carboxyvinyltransferase
VDKFIIEGGRRLKGAVAASGSKNASLPILAATILSDSPCSIGNVPRLCDVDVMARILQTLGVSIERDGEGRINSRLLSEEVSLAPYELVSMMRASFCVLGPLLAKRGYAKVSMPGGCALGDRPVDLHIKGLKALGAEIQIEHGYVIAHAKRLHGGGNIYLGGPTGSSVLGTANVMMAACLAEGQTVIEHAACEPEVVDLANFLQAMGASIEGAGSHRIHIRGVRKLEGCEYDVIPDRIEAATLLLAGAITQGEVAVKNIEPTHLEAVFDKFREAGIAMTRNCKVVAAGLQNRAKEVEIYTLPYPGFPTDLQAQMMALTCVGQGASVFNDAIYPDRLHHVAEFKRMGARIQRVNNTCVVIGREKLQGAPVMASDLRGGAALVLAGLAAEGETHVRRVYHIDRGYESFENKLVSLGASIRRAEDDVPEKPPAV